MLLERKSCLVGRPPVLLGLEPDEILKAGEGWCPVALKPNICLSPSGAWKIRRALEELTDYARDALEACGEIRP